MHTPICKILNSDHIPVCEKLKKYHFKIVKTFEKYGFLVNNILSELPSAFVQS